MRLRLQLLAAALACSCGTEPVVPSPPLGPDCTALAHAARRAQACDPPLGELVRRLVERPDERACRRAARQILMSDRPQEPRVRSLFEPDAGLPDQPLAADERTTLERLPLPAELLLLPDLPPAPGVPPTSANLDGTGLESDERGRLRGHTGPGSRTLELSHAGETTRYCVDLEPCARLSITAHGSKLARHPRVKRGSCGGEEEPDPQPPAPVSKFQRM